MPRPISSNSEVREQIPDGFPTVNNCGFTGVPSFTDWVGNIECFGFGLYPSVGSLTPGRDTGNSIDNIGEKLKTLDSKLLKIRKLQLEVAYFQQCVAEKIIPKGLRNSFTPTNLFSDSTFSDDLLVLFNRQGLELLELMIKHYNNYIGGLLVETEKLDCAIKNDMNFLRYKYDYNRIFTSIDALLVKLKFNKSKKLGRDRQAYQKGFAYPNLFRNTTNNDKQNVAFEHSGNATPMDTLDENFDNDNNDDGGGDQATSNQVVRRSSRIKANHQNNQSNFNNKSQQRPFLGGKTNRFQNRQNRNK